MHDNGRRVVALLLFDGLGAVRQPGRIDRINSKISSPSPQHHHRVYKSRTCSAADQEDNVRQIVHALRNYASYIRHPSILIG